MPRALAILKYVPAMLCGLLVVAWVVSLFYEIYGYSRPCGLRIRYSSLKVWIYHATDVVSGGDVESTYVLESDFDLSLLLGRFRYWGPDEGHAGIDWEFPIPFALTILLPVSIAPFTRFRFPLWSYFAWTALLAAELAYYLR